MKPVHQLCFRDPDGTDRGDCLRAAVASLLELDPTTVPHFVQEEEDGGEYWWDHLLRWLGERGLWIVDVPKHVVLYQTPANALLFATGVSPRDPDGKTRHMVVWEGGIHRHQGRGLVHDPHPDGTGLVGDPETWGYYMLAPLDPVCSLIDPIGPVPPYNPRLDWIEDFERGPTGTSSWARLRQWLRWPTPPPPLPGLDVIQSDKATARSTPPPPPPPADV